MDLRENHQPDNDSYSWEIRTFHELDLDALYALLHLRSEVFVVEQTCYYQDLDYKDQQADHVLVYSGDQLAGYARLFAPDVVHPGAASIGRVVTHPGHRGRSLGRRLMERSIDECVKRWPEASIRISAQVYLLAFYRSLGFEVVGEEYLEDGIPHVAMNRPSR
jgi:ElaA protein